MGKSASKFYFGLALLCVSLSCVGQKIPEPKMVWSVVLASDTSGLPNTSSQFEATRRVVIAGDRVVALADIGPLKSVNGRMRSTYKLFSVDLRSGTLKDNREFEGFGAHLYGTDDDHVIIGERSLERLNVDLTPTGIRFEETGHGRTIYMSADGTTLIHEIAPGNELIDTHTLKATGVSFGVGAPTSINRSGYITDNVHWIRDYPKDLDFITWVDRAGERLLYHGACSGRPIFVSETKVMVTVCGKVLLLDVNGAHQEAPMIGKRGNFAGASRNGLRFALQNVETGWFDPWPVRSEQFVIYDTESLRPIALVKSKELPSQQSWSAFSADGKLFVVGSPSSLRLYRLPD